VQRNNPKSVAQVQIYIQDLLKNCVIEDIKNYRFYIQGVINMFDKKSTS